MTQTVAQGDFKNDGVVDSAKYIWRDSARDHGLYLAAYADGDGRASGADLQIWRANYGLGSSRATKANAIPKPTSAVALVITG